MGYVKGYGQPSPALLYSSKESMNVRVGLQTPKLLPESRSCDDVHGIVRNQLRKFNWMKFAGIVT